MKNSLRLKFPQKEQIMDDREFKIKVIENLSQINEKLLHVASKKDLERVEGKTNINKNALRMHWWLLGTIITGCVTMAVAMIKGA